MARQEVDSEWIDVDEWEDVPAKPIVRKKEEPSRGIFDVLPSGTDIFRGAIKGAISIPETFVGLADIPTFGLVGKAAEKVGFKPKEAKEGLDILLPPSKQLQEQTRAFREAPTLTEKAKRALTSPALLGTSVVESAPSILPAAGIARLKGLSKLPALYRGATGAGAVSAGSQAEQIRQETGDLTPKQSGIALATGLATGGITAGLGKIATSLGFADLDQLITGAVKNPELRKNIAARIAGSGLAEGTEETFQSMVEQANQNVALNKPLMEGVSEAGILGGFAGSVLGAGAGVRVPRVAERITPPEGADILADQMIRPEDILISEIPPRVDFNTGEEAFNYFQEKAAEKRGTPEDVPDNEVARALEMERQASTQKVGKITVKKNVPETIQRLMKEGYKIVGQTEEGHPIMQIMEEQSPVRIETLPENVTPFMAKGFDEMADFYDKQITTKSGQESLKMMEDIELELKKKGTGDIEPKFSKVVPDQSIKTMRDLQFEYADKLEKAGKIDEANEVREDLQRGTEEDADELYATFLEEEPHLKEQLDSIYKEQDLEKIAQNAMEARKNLEQIAATHDPFADPSQEYIDASYISDLATSKYVRASKRVLEGEPTFQKDIPVDEEGKPIEVKEFTEEELSVRKKGIARNWAITRAKARELGIDDKRYRHLKDLQAAIKNNEPAWEEPSFQKVATGKKFQVGYNVKRGAQELTSGYSGSLSGIMAREGIQNAIDAVRPLLLDGVVQFSIDDESLKIIDNGPGMDLDAIMTVFRELHSSGKVTQEGATGGKGVGKASYMLGGKHFSLESVIELNGEKVKYSFEGTPDELMSGEPDVFEENVEYDTPTGVTITTEFKEGQEGWSARQMMRDVLKYSRGLTNKVQDISYGAAITEKMEGNGGKSILYEDMLNNEIEILIPDHAIKGTRSSMAIVYLNNGMYQFRDYMYLDEEVNGLPSILVVDIHPLMEEGAPDYPFPVQRESIKSDLKTMIQSQIKDTLVSPTANQRRIDLQKLWESMPPIQIGGMIPAVLLDPGNRLTAKEVNIVTQSPFIKDLMKEIDNMMMNILFSAGSNAREVVRLGLSFDDKSHGIHIPNPFDKGESSAIVINPFIALSRMDAERAAFSLVVTALHESAHAYKKDATELKYRPMTEEDLRDPKVGKYVATYMKEVAEQGGLDMGHGIAFIKQLGDIYNAFGTAQAVKAADRIERVIRQYSGEIPKILQIYTNSRGREATTDDILTGTGIKQQTGRGSEESVPGDSERVTSRTASRRVGKLELKIDKYPKDKQRQIREKLVEKGYFATGVSSPEGNPIWEQAEEVPGPIELSKRIMRGEMTWREGVRLSGRELWHLSKGLRAVDPPFVTSAMFRQARPMIGLNLAGWLKAWKSQAAAYGSTVTYNEIIDQISRDELFRRRLGPGGETLPSWAEEWGLQMPVLGKTTGREEMIQSNWAEMIPGWGAHVRASNRAFTAALATTRASALKNFIEVAKNQEKDPFKNLELGKEIANAINVLNGKGKLRLELPGSKKGLDIEGASTVLNNILFSPRYQASIVQMLNPAVYMNADPLVRKMYLKGLFSILIAWWSLAALAEAMGASVNKDPNNADFGKIRIGNWRLDLGNGIAQYLVLFSRLRPEWFALPFEVPTAPFGEMVQDPGGGKFSSSGTGDTVPLGETNAPTRGDLVFGARGFIPNKYQPTARLAWDILFTNRSRPVYLGDRLIQLVAPLMLDDLVEITNEDPMLLPFAFTASGIGLGSQFYEGGAAEEPIYTQGIENVTGAPLTEFDVQLGGR